MSDENHVKHHEKEKIETIVKMIESLENVERMEGLPSMIRVNVLEDGYIIALVRFYT